MRKDFFFFWLIDLLLDFQVGFWPMELLFYGRLRSLCIAVLYEVQL